ncbi:hypothetical protein CP97_10335 [Aurantiacibacter atlanticus]|uniref:Uncharacterized protein n=1 Tax=Aurantiacibacter atlanticus TaxID=1648404 RepID=A0A0H4VDC3_9SPHN|nr:hypothetical protein [Aurantiacibacter atlanticus]AKQ42335.1 hypothetical protein CP97_10335 [Aurantiacibacter atlanticus]
MTDRKTLLLQDRALRDAAKGLVKADLRNMRSDVQEQGVASRTMTRLREGAEGAGDDALNFARANPAQVGSVIVIGIAAFGGFIFRDRLAEGIVSLFNLEREEN